MDIWIVSTLLQIMLLRIFLYIFLHVNVFISLGYISRSEIAGSYGNYV